MAYNGGSPSGSGNYDGYPFPPTGPYGPSSSQKPDGPSAGFWSPGVSGYPLESPSSSMPWYFNPMNSPFNFNHAFAMSDAAGATTPSSGTGNQPSYFPPFPPPQQQQTAHTSNPHPHHDPHHQSTSYQPFHPSQPQPYQQPYHPQPPQPQPHQSAFSQPAHAPSHSFLAPPLPASHANGGLPARPSAFALPSGPLRLIAVASAVPPALIRDNSSSTRSSYSSGSSATSSQPGSAHPLPMCVDMSLVDGSAGGPKTIPAEVKMDDEDDGNHAIHAFETGTAISRRSSRNPTVTYEDIDAEGDEDDDDEPASEGESVASSSSSYHDGRQRAHAASTKRKIKQQQPKQPLPISASAKSSPTTSAAAAAKRRASAPSHLQNSRASSRAPSPPPSPLKRVRMAPLAAIHIDDDLSLPPLPADFDSYGPGGSSRFTDDGSGGGIAIPDFSGREDCWGIGKEAYQQLSAKAKKQLRNKLGARRFRERRKEYITTLEERIAGRDEIITHTRERLRDSIQLVKELQAKVQSLERASTA